MGNPNVGKSAVFSRLTGVQAIISNYPGTIDDCFYMLPNGPGDQSDSQEFGYGRIVDQSDPNKGYYPGYNIPAGPNFLVCSDDNRSPINLDFERIES